MTKNDEKWGFLTIFGGWAQKRPKMTKNGGFLGFFGFFGLFKKT
jgi:hypothetical protein